MLDDVLAASICCNSDRWLEIHCAVFDACEVSDITGDALVDDEPCPSSEAVELRKLGMRAVPLLACLAGECWLRLLSASLLTFSDAAKIEWSLFIEAVLVSSTASPDVGEVDRGNVIRKNGALSVHAGEEGDILEESKRREDHILSTVEQGDQ